MYGEGLTTYGIPEIIISYEIPTDHNYRLTSAIFWGDVAAEFLIHRNGEVVGGARTSESQRTIQVDYSNEILVFSPGDYIDVTAEHYTTGLRRFKGNLALMRM